MYKTFWDDSEVMDMEEIESVMGKREARAVKEKVWTRQMKMTTTKASCVVKSAKNNTGPNRGF
jgi:hypothetical protein